MSRRNYGGLSIWVKPDDITANKEKHISNYVRYMLARTQTMFEYTGLPGQSNQLDERITFTQRELELQLQYSGYTVILEQDGKLYCTFAGLGGEPDVYYMPTQAIIANPRLHDEILSIGENCVVIPNDSLYIGLYPLYAKYANLLTDADITLRLQNVNTRLPSIISASDDNTRTAAERFLRQVNKGEMGIIADNAFIEALKVNPYTTSNYGRLTDGIEYRQYLIANWYNEIGLQANYNMKRERLNTDEVVANAGTLLPLVDDMLNNRRKALEAVNKMFGTNIEVSFNSAWEVTIREVENMVEGLAIEPDENNPDKKDGETENVELDEQTEAKLDVV